MSTLPPFQTPGSVSVVAILKGEEPFVEEWVAYHLSIGVEHFFLYDNDPERPLEKILSRYDDHVTVIPWLECDAPAEGRNIQIKAYLNALQRIKTRWVTFIDGDEFIVLHQHENIVYFLSEYTDFGAILLTWHTFGHCGYYSNPPGLITESLLRRKRTPARHTKMICQAKAIASLPSVHEATLHPGYVTVDANKRSFSRVPYPGLTDVAHINHYMCRSFENWMKRAERGSTHYNISNTPEAAKWRFTKDGCLRQFVSVTKEWNEHEDTYMLKYSDQIRKIMLSKAAPQSTLLISSPIKEAHPIVAQSE